MRGIMTIVQSFVIFYGLVFSLVASAGPSYWEATKIAQKPNAYVNLLDSNQQIVATVSTQHVRTLMEVKSRIEKEASYDTTIMIKGDQAINAFAEYREGRNLIFLTTGLLQITGGDADQLAAVVGHEIAHHVRGHIQETAKRDSVLNIIGAFVGIALEITAQRKYNIQGLGLDLGNIGTKAVTSFFSRTQEREADALGADWMIRAGYNPAGAERFWTNMLNREGDSNFAFLRTHPNPSERLDNFRKIAAENSDRINRIASLNKDSLPVKQDGGRQQTATLSPILSEDVSNSAFRRGIAAYQKENYQLALKEFSSSSGSQDPRASYLVATLYLRGQGVDQSYGEALKWFQAAANDKFAPALTSLGVMHKMGWGVPRNLAKAVSLLEEAALLGDPTAEATLAPMYFYGVGTAADPLKAKLYIERSARKGNVIAEYLLGKAYERGLAGSVDYGKAFEYFTRASAKGVLPATARLGMFYEKGLTVDKNETVALNYYRRASEAGDAIGQLYLGSAYLRGMGVEKNRLKAFPLILSSAEKGIPDAQYLLGLMYFTGVGTTPDMVRAYVWLSLSEEISILADDPATFVSGTEKRKAIERTLSSDQIKEAEEIKQLIVAKISR